MPSDKGFDDFSRLLDALGPYLAEVVIVGGWAYRIYRFVPNVVLPSYDALFTEDADVALSPDIALPEELGSRLKRHGFIEKFVSDDRPPVTHFELGPGPFYAEFLTAKIGGGGRHGRTSSETTEIAGVVAQKLRYLDVLMIEPWLVTIPEIGGGSSRDVSVRVPNPVSFIAQKLLVLKRRKRVGDRAKDLLYIHDVIDLFSPSLVDLKKLWPRVAAGHAALKALVESEATRVFSRVDDDIREAALIARDRPLSPDELRLRCEAGLREIFGP